jgi:hypothetical protein
MQKIDSWYRLREKRNKFLEETDKTQLADFPVDTKTRGLYKEYRKYLRDLPKLFNEETIKNAKVKSFNEWLEFKKNGIY